MKDKSRLINFSDIDPAVSGLLAESETRKANRNLSPSARKKAARDKARNKLTVDIPPELENHLRELSKDFSIDISGLSVFLLERGLDNTTREEILSIRIPSRSLRFEFTLPKGRNQ